MSTTAERSPVAEQAIQHTIATKDRLLKTFSFVPDDKLTWKPSDTAKSALEIVAHAGVANGTFIGIMRGEMAGGKTSVDEVMAKGKAIQDGITTREQAIKQVEDSTAEVIAELEGMTPERIASDVETPIFTAPMPFWMNLPGRHMDNHACQIDYLQTCWGDMDWHM